MSTSDSILRDPQAFLPHASVAAYATISGMDAYRALVAEAERDYAGFWARLARETLDGKSRFSRFWMNRARRSMNDRDRFVALYKGEVVDLYRAEVLRQS